MKKIIAIILAIVSIVSFGACGSKGENDSLKKEKVVIYSVLEDYRNEFVQKELKKKFPQYDIVIQFVPTGNLAAKLKNEGASTEGDIVLALQAVYMEQLKDNLADLSSYDTSKYLDELVIPHHKYLVWERFSGCIMINTKIIEEKKLSVPSSYEDLLDSQYKGLISMPNPKSSSTGYIFLQSLVNAWGEEKAFDYFDKLSSNVLQFTTSGSGPISALTQGEAAIGLGITYQPVQQMNDGVENLEMLYFKEGAPYDIDGYGIIKGKESNQAVKEVFDYLYNTLIIKDKELYSPEQIFKIQNNNIKNYPKEIPYADMSNALNIEEKTRLLEKWKY